MKVDTIAAIQGVYDARSAHNMSDDDFIKKVIHAFYDVSAPGPNGRKECEYKALLDRLSAIEAEAWKWSLLWEHLGRSLSSGISVAN